MNMLNIMKNIKGKVLSVTLGALCVVSVVATPVYAEDKPEPKPNLYYGEQCITTEYEVYGPYKKSGYNLVKVQSLYSNWDSDQFECYCTKANRELSTSNTSTVKVSGSVSAGFEDFIEAELSAEVGEEWTKTSSVTYKAKKGYKYTLWSANKIDRKTYIEGNNFGKRYIVDLPGGHKQWFFREKLKR